MEERREVVLTGIDQLKEYLDENCRDNTIISISVEEHSLDGTEEGGADGRDV